ERRSGRGRRRGAQSWRGSSRWLLKGVRHAEGLVDERLDEVAGDEIGDEGVVERAAGDRLALGHGHFRQPGQGGGDVVAVVLQHGDHRVQPVQGRGELRSEEHTSELQSRENLVCRLLLEKKKKRYIM